MNVAALAKLGRLLLSTKWLSVAMYAMWFYDYFLTLGDEIQFAWSGRKSWIFALFLINRYFPVPHIIYRCLALFKFTDSQLCRASRWELPLYTTLAIVLAQMVIALRVYAVTGRGKLPGIVFCALIAAQFGFGLYSFVWYGERPMIKLPEVSLDAYKLCLPLKWRTGELTFNSITVVFDVLAFLMILLTARTSWRATHPGVPSILEVIVRDATFYFLVMLVNQLVLFMFLFFAPVQLRLVPGITQVFLLPALTSRMMLSLKKVAAEPAGMWSLSTRADFGGGKLPQGNGTVLFAPFDLSGGTSEPSTLPSEGDMELSPVPRLSQDPRSQKSC